MTDIAAESRALVEARCPGGLRVIIDVDCATGDFHQPAVHENQLTAQIEGTGVHRAAVVDDRRGRQASGGSKPVVCFPGAGVVQNESTLHAV